MKKLLALILSVAMLTACGGGGNEIHVVTREDGSGTRGAFVEIFGIMEEENGEKVDKTTESAETTNSTAVMMTSVQDNEQAIGYTSLGSMNDKVKALKIDGAAATPENVKNGSYPVQRPFNLAVHEEGNELVDDFIGYILSEDGQKIVEEEGYVPVDTTGEYTADVEGKIVVAGSSSISPVMEKLVEDYMNRNQKAQIELQQSDSTTGMNSAIEGVADIGMASRELKDSELDAGLKPIVMGIDGIAVIVNNENPVEELTSEQVKQIYTGEMTEWEK